MRSMRLGCFLVPAVLLTSLLLAEQVACEADSGRLVLDLTDDNFDGLTADGGAWMIEIYASWCSHCRQLEPQWNLMAKELAPMGIRAGKINGPDNRVLMSRFGIKAFPSIFFMKGGATWVYEGARTVQEFKAFATSGHEKESALPFWKAPTSLMGRVTGQLHRVPGAVKEAYGYLKKDKGLSDLAIVGGCLAVPVVVGAITICIVDALYLRQARNENFGHHEHNDAASS